MKIKYFAWLKNITKTDIEVITDSKIKDIESLKIYLCNKYPKIEEYIIKDDVLRIAINLEYTVNNDKLSLNDEIAIFPLVSGG